MTCPQDSPPSDAASAQADDRLLDALLLHLCDGQAAEHREQRVQRAMRAIREQAESAPAAATARLHAWWRGLLAAAAAAMLAVGLWLAVSGPTTALASLDDIIAALAHPGDRTYRIAMEDLPEPPHRADRVGSPPPPPERVPRPGLDGATLYLRDAGQYVLVRDDPNTPAKILDGYDGRQSWRVRRGRLAEIKDGLGAGGIPMPTILADVPFCDLHRTLDRIRTDYTIEQSDLAPLDASQRPLLHVLARRNSRLVRGPETIEIWANASTGMPRRIVFDRAKLQGNRHAVRLTFDLADEAPLPADWFTPGPHVSP